MAFLFNYSRFYSCRIFYVLTFFIIMNFFYINSLNIFMTMGLSVPGADATVHIMYSM